MGAIQACRYGIPRGRRPPRDGMRANLFVDGVEDGSLEDQRTWLTEATNAGTEVNS